MLFAVVEQQCYCTSFGLFQAIMIVGKREKKRANAEIKPRELERGRVQWLLSISLSSFLAFFGSSRSLYSSPFHLGAWNRLYFILALKTEIKTGGKLMAVIYLPQ